MRPEPSGDFLANAQGEDVVSGTRTPKDLKDLAQAMPDAHAELIGILRTLERHYHDMQDTEFTIEDGRLYMLQTRSAKRPAQRHRQIAAPLSYARGGCGRVVVGGKPIVSGQDGGRRWATTRLSSRSRRRDLRNAGPRHRARRPPGPRPAGIATEQQQRHHLSSTGRRNTGWPVTLEGAGDKLGCDLRDTAVVVEARPEGGPERR